MIPGRSARLGEQRAARQFGLPDLSRFEPQGDNRRNEIDVAHSFGLCRGERCTRFFERTACLVTGSLVAGGIDLVWGSTPEPQKIPSFHIVNVNRFVA